MGVVYFSIIPTFEPSRYCKCWIVCFKYRKEQALKVEEKTQEKYSKNKIHPYAKKKRMEKLLYYF